MIVCLEGPTGAGKSSLAPILAKEWEGGFRICPTVDYFAGCFPIALSEKDLTRSFRAFLRAEIAAALSMSKGENWIQDRNWISQLTYLDAMETVCSVETQLLMEELIECLVNGHIKLPHALIFMDCPPALTHRRRQQRGSSPWGDVPQWIAPSLKKRFREVRYRTYKVLAEQVFVGSIIVRDLARLESGSIPPDLRTAPPTLDQQSSLERITKWIQK
jgi:thymidylate kinase